MRKALASKAQKPNTPLGKVLTDVYSLRVEVAGNWSDLHRELTLIVVLRPGALPLTDDPAPEPAGLRATVSAGGVINPTKVAERLLSSKDEDVRYWCWILLADAWAAECQLRATEQSLTDHVRAVSFEVLGADEFTLDRVDRSEALDLDYLSPPLPRD
jgi:hypothetical protein